MVDLIYTCTCTSQGSGRPIEPGKKRPAANNWNNLLNPSTTDNGSPPFNGMTAQWH